MRKIGQNPTADLEKFFDNEEYSSIDLRLWRRNAHPHVGAHTVYFAVMNNASDYPNRGTTFLVAIVALIITLGHIVVLGVPGVLLLLRARQLKAWTAGAVGFALGCLPMGVWSWPLREALRGVTSTDWDGEKMVHSIVNGVPTLNYWISYGQGVFAMGALGAAAGFSFWFVWNSAGGQNPEASIGTKTSS